MRPACTNTKNPAFIHPKKYPEHQQAAKDLCASCPILKQCAEKALTAGTSQDGYEMPANDVIQAGVVCTGDYETAQQLATIAGVSVPGTLHKTSSRTRQSSVCVHCGTPMVRWNRHEQQAPDGYVMHYARGYCTQCRRAYREAYPRNRVVQLRKQVDRKRHSAPPRKSGVVSVQLELF